MSFIDSFKPNPVIATMAPGSDTVKWSDSISAPIIIPLTVFAVVLSIIILCIIKCLKTTYDRKLRSDRYEISDLIKERPSSSEIANLDTSQEIPDHPNLNLLKYSGEKKRLGHGHYHDHDIEAGGSSGDNSPPSRSSNGGRVCIEVHDSSNENNDNLTEEEDEDVDIEHVNDDEPPQISTFDSSPYSHHSNSRHFKNNQYSTADSPTPANSVHYANHNRSQNGSDTLLESHSPAHNPLVHAPLASTESEV